MFTPHNISHVMCSESLVTWQVSGVTCQVLYDTFTSQTVRARKLKFWEKVHLLPHVICHMERVTCLISCATCHASLNMIFYFQIYLFFRALKRLTKGLLSTGPTASSFNETLWRPEVNRKKMPVDIIFCWESPEKSKWPLWYYSEWNRFWVAMSQFPLYKSGEQWQAQGVFRQLLL